MKHFFKSNYLYLIWFILYFTIAWLIMGANLQSFFICLILYCISIAIALSPIGEFLLRQLEGVRRLETKAHKEYLLPLFQEVFDNAKEQSPNLPYIEICVTTQMSVNAFAIGRHTIAVTQGAIETFSPEELKGVIAHEIGHIQFGHTKALLLNVIGNGIFSILILMLRIVSFILGLLSGILNGKALSDILFGLCNLIIQATSFIFVYLGHIILAINSRQNEFQADNFALETGFGEELTNALYILQKFSLGQKLSLMKRLTSSHPHINKRIERLESIDIG